MTHHRNFEKPGKKEEKNWEEIFGLVLVFVAAISLIVTGNLLILLVIVFLLVVINRKKGGE